MAVTSRLLERFQLDRIAHGRAKGAMKSGYGCVSATRPLTSMSCFRDLNKSKIIFTLNPFVLQTRKIRISPLERFIARAKKRSAQRKKCRLVKDRSENTGNRNVVGSASNHVERERDKETKQHEEVKHSEEFTVRGALKPDKRVVALELMKKLVHHAEIKLSEAAQSNGIKESGDNVNSSNNSLKKNVIPQEYPYVMVLPISVRPLLPGVCCSLQIRDTSIMSAIMLLARQNQPYIGVFLAQDPSFKGDMIKNLKQIYDVGVFAEIRSIIDTDLEHSGVTLVLYPHRRIRIKKILSKTSQGHAEFSNPALPANGNSSDGKEQSFIHDNSNPVAMALVEMNITVAQVENVPDENFDINDPLIKVSLSEMLSMLRELCSINPLIKNQIISYSGGEDSAPLADASKITNIIAAISSAPPRDLQTALECSNIRERLHFGLNLLKAELENAKLYQSISKQVEKKITKRQREYFLMEQLKEIQRELGLNTDGKEKLVEGFKMKAMSLKMPQEVQTVFNEEISKLLQFDMASSEFNVVRNYLDWLTSIPWGIRSKEEFDIFNAKKILDADHYGLDEVKNIILEFIAIGKLKNSLEGKIICLCGPPGVGKTSVGKSMARALNRAFYRFSVGGLLDVAEIKGHRRTYVGAMPGKPIQALKRVRTENPLIMIDEIDKVGTKGHGDPSSALLELLDLEQNNAFLDHYMDAPIDLSNVLFVCTANSHNDIPPPLLDRMELINMSGYISEEKIDIAEKYLIVNAFKQCGLTSDHLKISREAIAELVKYYCRESGVRNLKKHIEKICRKVALKIVTVMQYNEDNAKIGGVKTPEQDNSDNSSTNHGKSHYELLNSYSASNLNTKDNNSLFKTPKETGKDVTKQLNGKRCLHDKTGDYCKLITDNEDTVKSGGKIPADKTTLSKSDVRIDKTRETSVKANIVPDPKGSDYNHSETLIDTRASSDEINVRADEELNPECSNQSNEISEINSDPPSEDKVPPNKTPIPTHNHNGHYISPFNKQTPSEENIRSDNMPTPSHEHDDHEVTSISTKTPSEENIRSDKMPTPSHDHNDHEINPINDKTPSEESVRSDKMSTPFHEHENHEINHTNNITPSEENIRSDNMPNPSHEHDDYEVTPTTDKTTPSEKNLRSDKMSSSTFKDIHELSTQEGETRQLASQHHNYASIKFPIVITPENLYEYVGAKVHDKDRLYEGMAPIGVVTGLAWTPLGGSILHVEAIEKSSKSNKKGSSFEYTGKMGTVMKESAEIAYSYFRKLLYKLDPQNAILTDSQIHLHVPEGATPKDGPSAGCTMVTSIISLALKQPVLSDIAMTGEITLTGRILKVGGIKVKIMAARRSGIKKIIMPKANLPDWAELPEYIKEGLEVEFVTEYPEIFKVCFPSVSYS